MKINKKVIFAFIIFIIIGLLIMKPIKEMYTKYIKEITLISSTFSQKVKSKKDTTNTDNEEEVVKAEYIGGINELRSFVARNIEYPEEALNNGIVGTVLVGFFIDEEGKISDFEIIKGIGGGCEEEVIRVLKLTEGKWKPAMENGQPVHSFYIFPIAFRLPNT